MRPRFCRYCRRGPLVPPGTGSKLEITRDHVKAKSQGGWKTVQCCRQCNQLKADIFVEEWFWFIKNHPRYWKTFATEKEVKRVIIAERTRRAFAREKPIIAMLMGGEESSPPTNLQKYHHHISKMKGR